VSIVKIPGCPADKLCNAVPCKIIQARLEEFTAQITSCLPGCHVPGLYLKQQLKAVLGHLLCIKKAAVVLRGKPLKGTLLPPALVDPPVPFGSGIWQAYWCKPQVIQYLL